MCLSRMISTAAKCSLVWGWGHDSLAAISSRAPSMTAAPLSMVAMRMSWPGQSTKETWRSSCMSTFSYPGTCSRQAQPPCCRCLSTRIVMSASCHRMYQAQLRSHESAEQAQHCGGAVHMALLLHVHILVCRDLQQGSTKCQLRLGLVCAVTGCDCCFCGQAHAAGKSRIPWVR